MPGKTGAHRRDSNSVILLAMAGAAALGIGMLIGLERERNKGEGDCRACAGLRTFAITEVLGYVASG